MASAGRAGVGTRTAATAAALLWLGYPADIGIEKNIPAVTQAKAARFQVVCGGCLVMYSF